MIRSSEKKTLQTAQSATYIQSMGDHNCPRFLSTGNFPLIAVDDDN